MAAELNLTIWFHPLMKIPFKIDAAANPFKISPEWKVADMMDEVELFFKHESFKAETPLELEISVLWNKKDHKKALNPSDKMGMHFVEGDTFGVYGDIKPAEEDVAEKAEEDKVPVTILTGFLGAGKTTLLNYILQEQKEKKIAIIENEFGEISIDDALLKQAKVELAEKVIVMDNGCMCCTIRGDLAKGLLEILDAAKKGNGIDMIMIETTGMADPVPIVRTFMSDPSLTREMRLDAVITMVDSKNLLTRLDDDIEEGKVNEAFQQVAFADKVILNKLDLVTTEEAITVKDRIRSINKFAKVLPAVKGQVKMTELMNIRAHDMVNFVNAEIDQEAEDVSMLPTDAGQDGHGEPQPVNGHVGSSGHGEPSGDHGGGGGHGGGGHEGEEGHAHAGHGHGHGLPKRGVNRHDTRVDSFAIVKEGEIDPKKLAKWMRGLAQLAGERGTIFRIKAILAVKGHPNKHVFHAVMDISDEDDAGPWKEGEKRISRIVFIGKSMDRVYLSKGFEDTFVKAKGAETSADPPEDVVMAGAAA